ncbi:Stealth CR1 domain-containing protein [uncultured Sulfitobacter sp.]|uniref:stealth family protein n=1 Tax=uncultured Sulfitobacter sp. TaxID=191468 RepID=UPI00261AF697|nr:Stealth CR1 domain-containing protein [uncultured Sulfitobacter sp.]
MTPHSDPIDAVITWVDGADPVHRAKRAQYMAKAGVLNENARNPHRWVSSDEIYFCLFSIYKHAPWIRTIWIVTDGQTPEVSHLPDALRVKICIVNHTEIFRGSAHVLPTFNSLAIESMIWRIEGLAERFLYFNDDVFLTAPLQPSDVFTSNGPVLRGRWVDYAAMLSGPTARDDPALFNHFMHVNAAAMVGVAATRLYACAHVVHPFLRSVMARLSQQHSDAFANNITHRFRDLSQFLPQGLHTHACIADGLGEVTTAKDNLHITSGQGNHQPPDITRTLLTPEALSDVKFLCINDLPQLERLIPDVRGLISAAVGGGVSW